MVKRFPRIPSGLRAKLFPYTLALAVFLLDQATKLVVSKTVRPWSVGASFYGDAIRIVRVYNEGGLFSLGSTLPDPLRFTLFFALPLAFLAAFIAYSLKTDRFTRYQRWCLSGVAGGGLGNCMDRLIRGEGVLDFVDIRVYGLFGLERWPVFNVADIAIVLSLALLLLSLMGRKNK